MRPIFIVLALGGMVLGYYAAKYNLLKGL